MTTKHNSDIGWCEYGEESLEYRPEIRANARFIHTTHCDSFYIKCLGYKIYKMLCQQNRLRCETRASN